MRTRTFLILAGAVFLASAVWGKVSVSPKKIKIDNPSVSCRETPFVPMVFFNSGSYEVDGSYDQMLKTLARRIAENPDAVVEIRGYYHIAGDGSAGGEILARNRAQKVREKITSFKPEIAGQVLVEPALKSSKPYRGQDGSLDIKIQQENQRAEISARLKEPMRKIFGTTDASQVVKMLDSSGDLYRFVRALEDNPLFFMLITVANPQKLDDANQIRKKIAKKVDSDAVKRRIFIAWGDIEGTLEIKVSPQWVVAKPTCDCDVKGNLSADRVEISGDAQIDGIYREDGLFVSAAGSAWNLNPIPDPTRDYFASGWKGGAVKRREWSDPIKFSGWEEVDNIEQVLVLANYEIDQTKAPEDDVSRANRDVAALQIARIARKMGVPITVTIAGYTDDTGDDEKNRQMSLFWAQKEFEKIKPLVELYMGKKIKMTGENSGQCGNVKFEIVGMKNANDNPKISEATPRGRIAKRRVEVQIR